MTNVPSPRTQVLLAEGEPTDAPAAGGNFLGNPIVMLGVMFAIFYFLMIRPGSVKEKERGKRVAALEKGDEVVLTGGIIGRVSNLNDPKIAVVELADKVKVRVRRSDIQDTLAAAMQDDKTHKPKSKARSDAEASGTDNKAEGADASP